MFNAYDHTSMVFLEKESEHSAGAHWQFGARMVFGNVLMMRLIIELFWEITFQALFKKTL